MRTKEQIEAQLQVLRERLEADDFEDEDEPDWSDTSNRITALEWALGISEDEDL